MSAGDQPKRNGVDAVLPDLMEVNPVTKRPALKQVAIPASDPQPVALRKVAESQIAQVTRLNNIDADLVELGAKTVVAFTRTDMRLELLDRKVDERFDELRRDLGIAHREHQKSENDLAERVGDLEDEITSPGFDRRTGRVVTRHELEARELKAKLEAAEEEKAKLEKAAEKAAEDAKESKRARRNLVYAIIGSLVVAAVTSTCAYVAGHAHGAASVHQVVEPEAPEAPGAK